MGSPDRSVDRVALRAESEARHGPTRGLVIDVA
jgi:hypothetical protein